MNGVWQALAGLVGEALARRWLAAANKPPGDLRATVGDRTLDVITEVPTTKTSGQHGLSEGGDC